MDRAKSANKAVARALGRKGIELEESAVAPCPKVRTGKDSKKPCVRQASQTKTILRVLEMYSDKNKREEEIKNIAKTYKEIEEGIVLPDLRRSQVAVTYTVGKLHGKANGGSELSYNKGVLAITQGIWPCHLQHGEQRYSQPRVGENPQWRRQRCSHHP